MQKGLIGKKLGMTQLFDANGNVVPVTVIEAGPCVVAQKKTVENDGYDAVQIGYGDLKASKTNKPMKGHFAKNDVAPKKVLREFRLADCAAGLCALCRSDARKYLAFAYHRGTGWTAGRQHRTLRHRPSPHVCGDDSAVSYDAAGAGLLVCADYFCRLSGAYGSALAG